MVADNSPPACNSEMGEVSGTRRTAAEALQKYLAKASGVRLPIVSASEAPAEGTLVLVGAARSVTAISSHCRRNRRVIGAKTLYTASGDYASLQIMPRSYETSYATYKPATDRWSGWKELEMPEANGKSFPAGCGCSQWLVKPDGAFFCRPKIHTDRLLATWQTKVCGNSHATVLGRARAGVPPNRFVRPWTSMTLWPLPFLGRLLRG